jgi:Xaa-Pro aminopeptidase
MLAAIDQEIAEKTARVARLMDERKLAGVLLLTQRNFAWLTGGRSNRVDGSRELGAGALLVARNGRRAVIANAIEMPRLLDEELAGQPYEPIELDWAAEKADPSLIVRAARSIAGDGALAADWPFADLTGVEPALAAARVPLTAAEVDRYRALGRDAGAAVVELCRQIEPGSSEIEIARWASDAIAAVGARSIVTLVAADDRIDRYRHPLPTSQRWHRLLMVVVCAERGGLVASLTRLLSAGRPSDQTRARTRACAIVFARLLAATRTGVSGRELYDVAVRAYAEVGFAGEERRHHQGGACGYRSREWFAHPASTDVVSPPQAFAWNPSITGTKVEETALATAAGVELLTTSPDWPSIPIDVLGSQLEAPDILPV